MARLANITKDQLKPEDHQYWDEIVGSRGSIRGPFGVLLHSPKLAARVASTGAYVRFDFDEPEALKETVIIAAAREIKNQYIFAAHARLARQQGVKEETIKAIASGAAPQGLSGDEALVVQYVKELVGNHKVSDATFNAVMNRFGVQHTIDLTGLIGHYLLVGQILTAFEVDLPPDARPEIPN